MKYTASIGTVFRNETENLIEWIEYHLLIGFEHFYLYCNDDDPTESKDLLQKYINKNIIKFVWYKYKLEERKIQQEIFNKILTKHGATDETKWVAFIDIDEFILPLKHNSINDLLVEYADYGSLVMYWHTFTNKENYVERQPLTIEAYKYRLAIESSTFKTIMQPKKCMFMRTNHRAKPFKLYKEINEAKERLTFPFIRKDNIVVINHYRYKSKQEYDEKIENFNHHIIKNKHSWEQYNKKQKLATVFDNRIHKHLAELKRRLNCD